MNIAGLLESIAAALGPLLPLLLIAMVLAGLSFFAFKFLVLQAFFKEVQSALAELLKVILPTKWDSGKALIWISIFSWGVSMLVGPMTQGIIAFVGWLFLIPGVHWVMHEEKKLKELLTINGFFLGPWITGGLICYFLFATPDRLPPIALICWPPISAILAGAPKFIGTDDVYKTPKWKKAAVGDRQYLVNMGLINLLLSCWIQLFFSTQSWLAEYPSLVVEDMSNSSFVVRTQSSNDVSSRGVELLGKAEMELKKELSGASWSEVERWLLNLDQQMETLQNTVIGQSPKISENSFWNIKAQILPGEYQLRLFAIWKGPTADNKGYFLSKVCQISKVTATDFLTTSILTNPTKLPQVGTARVQCGAMEGLNRGEPDLTRKR